jgi:hypothetical protein
MTDPFSTAKQVAKFLVPPVETARVSAQKPLHTGHQIGLHGFDHQMEVVGHETIPMDLPTGLLAGLAQSFEEVLTVLVIGKYLFATIAAVHDVVKRAGILNAQLAGHRQKLIGYPPFVSIVMTDPFFAQPTRLGDGHSSRG